MFTTPGTPNLTDYLSFLYGTVGIPPKFLPSLNGVATGGTNTSLIDVDQTWTSNEWLGYSLLDMTQGMTAFIAESDPQTLNFAPPPLANPVAIGDTYTISPGVVGMTLSIAKQIVNQKLALASPDIYVWAVYNLAADRLINYAPDQKNQTYFFDKRAELRILDVTVGVPSSANDNGTGVGILNSEQMKMLTIQDLQKMKTIYGRTYLGFAQSVGTLWGLS